MGLPLVLANGGSHDQAQTTRSNAGSVDIEDAETAVKHRVNGRDLNLFYSAETPASSVRLCARVRAMNSLI
jgi:hypothetical protein